MLTQILEHLYQIVATGRS